LGHEQGFRHITRLETQGRRVPDLELYVLATALGVTIDELFPENLGGEIANLWPIYRTKLSRGQIPPGQ
jgi:hypothetical protein